MSTRTPGPWKYERWGTDHRSAAWHAGGIWQDGVRVATVDRRPRDKASEEDANGRLIAAAPRMLETLQWALKRLALLQFDSQTNHRHDIADIAGGIDATLRDIEGGSNG